MDYEDVKNIDTKAIQQEVFNETRQALENTGITLNYLSKNLKKLLKAKKTITQKVKGSPNDLPKKCRIITTTGVIETVRGEDGPEREYSDGESLIQWDEADTTIQLRALVEAHKLRGDYPAEKHEHSGNGGGPIQEHITIEFIGAEHGDNSTDS